MPLSAASLPLGESAVGQPHLPPQPFRSVRPLNGAQNDHTNDVRHKPSVSNRLSNRSRFALPNSLCASASASRRQRMWSLRRESSVVNVNTVLYYLFRQLMLLCKHVAVLTDQAGSDWADRSVPIFDKVVSLWPQIDEWARVQLEETEE